MEFRILGPLEVEEGDRSVTVEGVKRRAVLALLLLEANRVVPANVLIDQVWGEDPPRTVRSSLQNTISQLRRVVGARLERRPPGYVLRVEPGELDLDRFRRLVVAARHAAPDSAALLLRQALGLWRGPALAELADEPAGSAVAHLDELRLAAVEQRIDADLELGRHVDLVPELEALVEEHPFREQFQRQLMLALYRSGRQADALDAYTVARRRLVEELGTEPDENLRRLQRAILQRDRALEAPRTVDSNLPVPPTHLVGRERELREIVSLLDDPDFRLVTITGPGGIGKTRLALEAAGTLSGRYLHGIHFVDLSLMTDARQVLPHVAQTVGLAPTGGDDVRGSVVAALAGLQLLLVVDGFEHVAAAAPDVATVLAACPRVDILVTSRSPLRITAEREYVLELLSLADASKLLVERAEAAGAPRAFVLDEETASAVCRRVDRLPLGLELAAARLRLLTPRALLERVEHPLDVLTAGPVDLPARQRSLRATIDWSYETIPEPEQRLFERLGVFAGPATLDAIAHVTRSSADLGVNALDALAVLADASLVRPTTAIDGELRFAVLDTIREYARERLAERGDRPRAERRHTTYYVRRAEELQRQMRSGADQPFSLDALESDMGNFRAALARAGAQGRRGARLAVALEPLWRSRGYAIEGRDWLERVLAVGRLGPRLRAAALVALGQCLVQLSVEHDRARAAFDEAAVLARGADDPALLAVARALALRSDDRAGAEAVAAAAGEISALTRSLDDAAARAWLERNTLLLIAQRNALVVRSRGGRSAAGAGDEQVIEVAERVVELAAAASDDRCELNAQATLGYLNLMRGAYERAHVHATRRLELARRLRDPYATALGLGDLQALAIEEGDAETLRRLLVQEPHAEVPPASFAALQRADHAGYLALLDGDHDRAERLFRTALSLTAPVGDRVTVWHLARIASRTGRAERAATLIGWARSRTDAGDIPTPGELRFAADTEREVRDDLDAETLERCAGQGAAMSLDELCSYLDEDERAAPRPRAAGRSPAPPVRRRAAR